jgi:hypothetical protein
MGQQDQEDMAARSQPCGAPKGAATEAQPSGVERCAYCFKTSETEAMQVRRRPRSEGGEWVESSVRLCANPECRAIRAGSLEDRLTFVSNTYEYKYFGDYELSEEQQTAVWEAYRLANHVPELLAALSALLGCVDRFQNNLTHERVIAAEAAIAKAEGR